MTNERETGRLTPDDDRPSDRGATQREPERDQEEGGKPEEKSPWLREGADAPDAADIAEPERQR
jgi:hypothetical protein